ncbi:LuxR C-terminal-related transcriptional regulator [Streptomyces sp. TLI_171]|uniref:LuxR C-terminal-related transcriptional regulator n=1 Tax=Streptomyces sp. TLI_171 TaxID=1938859 RepID=UPI0015D53E70|nr:LuxR C-terminal-related transcriptional regulator [Streptomyces sp. TLI_171]
MPETVSGLPFVGRRAELSALRAALRRPSVRAAVLTGPPGVGKSRTGEEFLLANERARHRCWRIRATEAASAVPLLALAPLLPAEHSDDPVELFREVSRRMGERGGPRPVVLVDDIHLLDQTSLSLLALLAEQAGLFLAATLPAGTALPEALRTWWRQDALHHLTLDPLDPADGARLLEAALGGPVATPARAAFASAGGGNPLLLRELLRSAVSSGALRELGGVWCLDGSLDRLAVDGLLPDALRELPRELRTVLELLALCGPVGLDDAQSYAGLDGLAELEELGLVTVGTERRRTRIALAQPWHAPLLRARTTLVRARSLLLAQAARVRAHGARRESDELDLARWELEATGTSCPDLLVRAAEQALRADDVPTMCRLARAALQHGPNVAAGLMLGEALGQQGEFTEAVAVLRDAFAAARTEGEVEAAAVTLAQSLCFGLERVDEARAVLTEAAHRIGDRPALTGCQAVLLAAAGRAAEARLAFAGRLPCRGSTEPDDVPDGRGADTSGREDRGEDRGAGGTADPAGQGGVLTLQARLRIELATGRVADAVESGRDAYVTHRRLAERSAVYYPVRNLYLLAVALLEAGRLDEAEAAAREGQQAMLHTPVPALTAWFPWALGRIALDRGRPATALGHFREARAQARLRRQSFAAARALAGAVLAAAHLGQVAPEAVELTAPAGPDAPIRGWDTVRAQAWVTLCAGNLPTATALLRSAAGHALADGEVTAAVAMLDDLVRWGVLEDSDALAAAAARMQGPYAAARARLALACAAGRAEEIESAAARLADLGVELRAAEGFASAAHAWQAAGHRARATRAAQRAQDLGALCEAAATPGLTPLTGADPLSSREREIALMAARGRTSREIAAECVLSTRTVDNHLARIYRKLGIANRTELSAILFPAASS